MLSINQRALCESGALEFDIRLFNSEQERKVENQPRRQSAFSGQDRVEMSDLVESQQR